MERKKYISPVCTVMEMKVENALLSMSQGTPGAPTIGQAPVEIENDGSVWELD